MRNFHTQRTTGPSRTSPLSRWRPRTALTLSVLLFVGASACDTGGLSVEPSAVDELTAKMAATKQVRVTCTSNQAERWRGVTLVPVGRALLGVGDDANPVKVSRLGPSGRDGLLVCFDEPVQSASYEWDLDNDGQFDGNNACAITEHIGAASGATYRERVALERGKGAHRNSFRIVHGWTSSGDQAERPVEELAFLKGEEVQALGPRWRPEIGDEVIVAVSESGASDSDRGCGNGIVRYSWDFDYDGSITLDVYLESAVAMTANIASQPTVVADHVRIRFPAAFISMRNKRSSFDLSNVRGFVLLMELVATN